MEESGMTDKQFKALVRLLSDAVKNAREESDILKKDMLLDKILDNLQKTLEDN